MILDDILENLKNKYTQVAYTVNRKKVYIQRTVSMCM